MKRFLTVLHTISLAVACISVPFAIFIVLKYMPSSIQVPRVTNAELLSTILAALTIMLGVVAIVIAGLALWGYHAIKDEAKNVATAEARKSTTEFLMSTGAQAQLREEAQKIAAEEVSKLLEAQDFSSAFQSSAIGRTIPSGKEKENPVGKPYPKGQQ